MLNNKLIAAVENFAALMIPLSDQDLDHNWEWKGYEEGVRFAYFVTIQELRELAVLLAAENNPPTQTQRILAQYHSQYMNLRSSVFLLPTGDAETAPAEKEWPIREAYAHIMGAEFGFRAVIRFALEGHRTGKWTSEPPADSEYPRLYGISEDEYAALMKGPLEEMVAYHSELHASILEEFSTIADPELDLPSTFWEEIRFPIRYRLHRFEAHILQHTIQIDKTLVNIGSAPSESRRLTRYLFAALAEVNSSMIGSKNAENPLAVTTTAKIEERREEITSSLNQQKPL